MLAGLLARPWWQPAGHAVLLRLDGVCLIAVVTGLGLAVGFWRGPGWLRASCAAVLLALTVASPWTALAAVVALPCTAALRRAPAAVLREARVGGAGSARVAASIVVPAALPGVIFGGVLVLAAARAGPLLQMAASALPLLLP